MNTKSAESIKQRYEELQPANGRDNTPRIGYYLIRDVFKSVNFGIDLAISCWKELESDHFNLNVEFTIQLLSLYEGSNRPSNFNPEALKGKVVQVNNTYNDVTIWKGKERPIVHCKWIQLNLEDVFSPIPSLLETHNDVSINELCNAFDGSIGNYIDYENELMEEAHIAPDQEMFPVDGDAGDDIFPDERGPDDDSDPDWDQDDVNDPKEGK